jgi:hypothetical protein
MLSDADWLRMQADLAAIRGDNEIDIEIRRGDSTLPSQPVRIARTASGRVQRGEGTRQSEGRAVVLGGTDFDVQPGDRFTDPAGNLYEIVFVRPNRRAAVVAEANMIE